MKMKIIGIFVCSLLVTTILPITGTVIAGDEDDPEIVDEVDDVIGILIDYPNLFTILQTLGILNIETFDFMDITSADLYEDPNEPGYLFASIRIKDLEYTPLRAIYAIRWTYDEKQYAVGCHTHSNGEFKWFFAGRIFGLLDNWAYKRGLIRDISECAIDVENNFLAFRIPKSVIGNPAPGDVLTETNAWTGLRFIGEVFSLLFGGEMARDPTSYGNEYIIKY